MSMCFNNRHFVDCEMLHNITIPHCSLVVDMNIVGFLMGIGGWALVFGICIRNYYQSTRRFQRLRYIIPERQHLNQFDLNPVQ